MLTVIPVEFAEKSGPGGAVSSIKMLLQPFGLLLEELEIFSLLFGRKNGEGAREFMRFA